MTAARGRARNSLIINDLRLSRKSVRKAVRRLLDGGGGYLSRKYFNLAQNKNTKKNKKSVDKLSLIMYLSFVATNGAHNTKQKNKNYVTPHLQK